MSAPLVAIDGLSVRFGRLGATLQALDEVSLSLDVGEVIGLVGESGSGKSTLANALGRLLPPTASVSARQMAVAGFEVNSLPVDRLRHYRQTVISYIFQDPMASLDPTKKVGAYMRLVKPEPAHQLAARLADVGIRDPDRVLNAYPHQLSGGMAQRVTVAAALMRRPQLLVADEPTAALDASLKREVMDLMFKRCAELGTAVVFVSHDLPLVHHYTTSTLVMYAGRIVEERETVALFANPLHPYTRALLGAEPGQVGPGERLVGLPGLPAANHAPASNCSFHPRCGVALPRCRDVRPEAQNVPAGQVKCLLFDATAQEAHA